MAYILHYWEDGNNSDTHYELRAVRLKGIEEVFPLSLIHNRPHNCTLITLDRSDNQSETETIVWEKGWDFPDGKLKVKSKIKNIRNKIKS